jgi:hypothetical protein
LPTISAGRRALIWPTYHFVYAPGIVGHGGTIASVFWIFMQAIASPGRALCRVEHVDCDLAAGTGGTMIVQQIDQQGCWSVALVVEARWQGR